ncbi:hypothetical protein TNCV_1492791 [Trichonephila clavipes]|nr:hypothetical protein TNCV_1492791 [Trichonephila clavipes]
MVRVTKSNYCIHFLPLSILRNREVTSRDLVSGLQATTGIRISRFTVARRLNEAELFARKPMICVPLFSAAKRARLNWHLRHAQWNQGDSIQILFTDESRYIPNTVLEKEREEGTHKFYLPFLIS